jgi:hypothetical protein
VYGRETKRTGKVEDNGKKLRKTKKKFKKKEIKPKLGIQNNRKYKRRHKYK